MSTYKINYFKDIKVIKTEYKNFKNADEAADYAMNENISTDIENIEVIK